jgi:DNA repair exonuclease SbcCD ATPase subunit
LFEGGLLDGKEINFSPELNNFIGIRGSGKSSIIEILRYAFGISLGSQASDRDYKNSLIEHVLKSGAKVTVAVVNEHKKEYRIEKIYGQKEDIYENNARVDAAIDAIFKKPVYFGQKDLSNKDIDFEADLVKKLIGNRLDDMRSRILAKSNEIEDVISSYNKLANLEELKKETNERIRNAEEKLKIFKEKGVQEKLKQQSDFDSDISSIIDISVGLVGFQSDIKLLIENHSVFFKNTTFKSEENKELFKQIENVFENIKLEFNKLNNININLDNYLKEFKQIENKLKDKKESLKEEFAKIKREINIPSLNPDDFLKLNRQIETSKLKLIEIEKSEKKRTEYLTSLNNKISELNNLWHEEFKIVENEVKRINDYKSALSITAEYKKRRDKFLDILKQVFKGSGITELNYKKISETCLDFVEIYRDKGKLSNILNENHLAEFNKRFMENLSDLLTYQVDTKFTIKYNDKPLEEHSLGQRATALILFLLAQEETNVLIIDQPEDDLDNQTIYEDVIKAIKALKGKMQFIFATHNANIPVLGDSEKIISCKYSESKIEVQDGTIDNHETQKQIVTIMEGGEEAFNRRKNIYELWSLKK